MSKAVRKTRFGTKVLLQVSISYDVYKKLIEILPKVYDYHKGALSDAVEDAIKLWIAEHTLVHNRVNPRPAHDEAWKTVITQAKIETDFNIPRVVRYEQLLGWVMRALRIKERSAKGWIFTFMNCGFIKPLQAVKIVKASMVNRCRVWEIAFTS